MRVKVVLINICKTIAAIQKGPKILPMDNWDIAGQMFRLRVFKCPMAHFQRTGGE